MLADRAYQLLPWSVRSTASSAFMKMISPRMRSHFSDFVSPGDLVFDVGANVGDLTQVYLDLGARVVAIDPQPYCVSILKKRFADNPRVRIVEKGVSQEKGSLDFFISKQTHTTSTFSKKVISDGRFNNRTWDRKINVEVTTLDELIDDFGEPRFLKIDVEGFERKVLNGLHHRPLFLSYEFHREFLEEARFCAEYLTMMGDARFNYSLFFGYSLQSDRWLELDELFEELTTKGKWLNGYLSGDIYVRFA